MQNRNTAAATRPFPIPQGHTAIDLVVAPRAVAYAALLRETLDEWTDADADAPFAPEAIAAVAGGTVPLAAR